MYESAIDSLAATGLAQYEISNFARRGCESRHNLRYWQRRPYLGLGLDASSMLRESVESANSARPGYVLRFTNTDDLKAYLEGPQSPETAWLSPERQHEEAWFLGLRLNGGISVSALRQEFGNQRVARALAVVGSLTERGLLTFDDETAKLSSRGRMLSNDVFQEFLEPAAPDLTFAAH
jgi:oxygen-independent coproporphyrinogen-3 oxidase